MIVSAVGFVFTAQEMAEASMVPGKDGLRDITAKTGDVPFIGKRVIIFCPAPNEKLVDLITRIELQKTRLVDLAERQIRRELGTEQKWNG